MDKSVEKLLREAIKASDRTTHAVRAFVYFLFLQLAFTTIALFLWFVSTGNLLDPIVWLQWVAYLVWFLGVLISSWVGWSELKASEVPEISGNVRETKSPTVDEWPKIDSKYVRVDATPTTSRPGANLGIDPTGRIVCMKCGVWEMVDDGRCLACDTQ